MSSPGARPRWDVLLRRWMRRFLRRRWTGRATAQVSSLQQQEQSIEGRFWVPDRQSDSQAGVLRIGPGRAPTIATTEPLLSPWEQVSRAEDPDGQKLVSAFFSEERLTTPITIHGLDDCGRQITVLSAATVYWGSPNVAGYKHELRGIQAIVGGHVRDRDHQFTAFRVRLRNVEAWLPLLEQGRWATRVPIAEGGRITMEALPGTGEFSQSGAWLAGRELPPTTLRGLEAHFIQPLISFFTLATDRSCPPLTLQVQENSPDGPWWDVYSAALQADSDRIDLRWDLPNWLLQPSDVGLREVGAWLDKVGLLGPLPAVVADLAQASPISLDTQALLLATVAEGLHRRLYPGDLRFHENADQNARIAALVRDAAAEAVVLVHADAKAAVRGLVQHVGDVGYAKRLTRLANAAEAAAPEVTGKTSRWKTLVAKVRNEYAHRISAGFLSDKDIDDRMTVAFSLRWLLTTVLLLQANIDVSVLRTRLDAHESYRRFLADAQIWSPEIYRST
jgi:ApeA N-terminal domain 1